MPVPSRFDKALIQPLDDGVPAKFDKSEIEPLESPAPPAIDLSNANGEGVYPMWNTSGKKEDVPYSYVEKASGFGYQFDINPDPRRGGKFTPMQQYAQDAAADPNRAQGVPMTLAPAGARWNAPLAPKSREEDIARRNEAEAKAPAPIRAINGVFKGAATIERPVLDLIALKTGQTPQEVSDMLAPRTPLETAAKWGTVGAVAAPALYAAPVATLAGFAGGSVAGAAGKYGGRAAGLSPQQAEVLGDVTGLAGGVGGAKLADAIGANMIAKASPLEALKSVFARTPSANKNVTAQELAESVVGPMRTAAAHNPEVAKAATTGDPVNSIKAAMFLLSDAAKRQHAEGDLIGASVEDVPVDVEPVDQALTPTWVATDLGLDDLKWNAEFRQRIGSLRTLGDLNEARSELGERVSELYNKASDSEGVGKARAYKKAADAIRNLYYKKVQELTGTDLRSIKRVEGDLIEAQDSLAEHRQRLSGEHQKHVERKTPGQMIGGVLKGGTSPATQGRGIIAGIGNRLEGSELSQMQAYMKRALSSVPAPAKVTAIERYKAPAPKKHPTDEWANQ